MTMKLIFAVIATGLLANCSGIGGSGTDEGNLPVRSGPQSQLPYSNAAPTAVIVTDA
mgnify:CR=1 FL=1